MKYYKPGLLVFALLSSGNKAACSHCVCYLSPCVSPKTILALFTVLTKFDEQGKVWKILCPIEDKIFLKILGGNDLQCLCDAAERVCSLFHIRYSPLRRAGQYLGSFFLSLSHLSKMLSNHMITIALQGKRAFIFSPEWQNAADTIM